MNRFSPSILFAMTAALGLGCSHHNVHDTRAVKVGVLTCESVEGSHFSLLVHSSTDYECKIVHSGIQDRYRAQAGIAAGVDSHWRKAETLRFTVFSAHAGEPEGFLAGRFVGARASATLGAGGGAKVLVGGGDRHLTLKPLALSTSTGVGVSAGIAHLTLEAR